MMKSPAGNFLATTRAATKEEAVLPISGPTWLRAGVDCCVEIAKIVEAQANFSEVRMTDKGDASGSLPSALSTLVQASRQALRRHTELDAALGEIAAAVASLTVDANFVRQTFSDDTPFGNRTLYQDPDFAFHVLAHVQRPGKGGLPHSHGESWAAYGNVTSFTDMRLETG